ASSVSPRIICTRSKWSPSTGADARAALWRRERRRTRVTSFGGRILVAAVATSASSQDTGSDRPTYTATSRLSCCRARRRRSPPSERNGTGATSTRPLSSDRSEEHTSELQSRGHLVCRLLLEKKKN